MAEKTLLSTLAALSDAELIARVKGLATREREATAQLVAHLAVPDTRDACLREGYPSLFVYCRDALGLSEGEAYNRIEVARAARRFPVILEMLANGETYLWAIRLLAPHLTPGNHREVLESARGRKSKLAIQEIVARLAPRPDAPTFIQKIPAPAAVPEWFAPADADPSAPAPPSPAAPTPATVLPLSPDRYKFQLTISGDMLDKLRLAKDMLSHVIPAGNDEAVLDRALEAPVVELAKKKFAATRPRKSAGRKDDGDIAAAVKRIVYVRDRGRCTFVGPNGHRCEERRYVQFHHIHMRALGGKATPDNITLRCRAHNDYEGRLWFGKRRRPDGATLVGEEAAPYGAARVEAVSSFQNKLGASRCAPSPLTRPKLGQ